MAKNLQLTECGLAMFTFLPLKKIKRKKGNSDQAHVKGSCGLIG